MDWFVRLVVIGQSAVFDRTIFPLLQGLGLARLDGDAYVATGWLVIGLAQIALVWLLLRPLEAWRPVETWTDRRAVRVDVLYTFLERLGLMSLLFFVALQPAVDWLEVTLRVAARVPYQLDDAVLGQRHHPMLAFVTYAVVLDLLEYARHRLQHRYAWWWALHSVHHSQRQLSFWADDRNHLVDSLLANLWRALAAIAIGVPGPQFALIVLLTRGIESLSHANTRLWFGRVGERLVVGPRFHRLHHAIGAGHEGPAGGCNFATLLPVWDLLFGTADFRRAALPTGIRDQLDGADYGRGFWAQQLRALGRLFAALGPGRRFPAAPGRAR
ncbi:MAG TPA: sterol desaturase family protein [Candidatus Methylomirabilis sp.]|nr:sterol desaturase family protein [Candidatus Methylomirabilis sp.]